MSDLLSAAAAALGLPEALVQRSAEARAAETGASTGDILAAWAGGEPMSSPAPASPTEPAGPASTSDPADGEPVAPPQMPAAVVTREPAAPVGGRAPIPPEVTAAEASLLPDVITVPTAGIRERTNFSIPRWLTSVLVVAPLFALLALGGSATGECGEATELLTDVVSGEIVNCDGSAFTGRAIGGAGPDYIALGQSIYEGTAVAGVNCAGCHGAGGLGAGSLPALTGVMTTFAACADHVEWVTLGSPGFAGGTYGDTGKTVAGGMPGFASSLSPDQIAAVSAFERVRFGGGDADAVLADCGLGGEEAGNEDASTDSGGEASTGSVVSG